MMTMETQHLVPVDLFAGLGRTGYCLRDPAPSPSGLLGPYRAQGICLDPVSLDGDLQWFDANAQPRDGDFVLVRWSDEEFARLRLQPTWADFVARYGVEPGRIATKLYKSLAGWDFL